jgi:acyl-CoA synthetase (AMP-forming)/AMP-acid ligase II
LTRSPRPAIHGRASACDGYVSEVTLRWTALDRLTPEQRARVVGPGAPFELVEEDVLGTRMEVFARRQRDLREVLVGGAERFGDLPYLVFPDREFTFRSVLGTVASVAAVLRDRYRVGPGDRVAIIAPNIAGHAITSWASICLGAMAVVLNGWCSGPEIEHGLSLTTPKVLFGDDRRLNRLDPAAVDIPVVRFEDEFDAMLAYAPDAAMPHQPMAEDDPVVIMFTSGTTGRPKGATLSHRGHIHMAMQTMAGAAVAAAAADLPVIPPVPNPRSQACSIGIGPMFHVSGLSVQLIGAPLTGSKIVYAPPGRWSEETYLELTERHRPTRWSLVPTQLWRLLEWPSLQDYDISSVMGVGGGSATWDPEMIRQVAVRIPTVARVSMGYGLTETTGGGTNHDGPTLLTHPGSVGKPCAGSEVQIRSPEGGEQPDGEVGEVCLRSAMNFLGYWNNPEATAAALDDDRWFRSGDFGRIEDGLLYLESRRSDLIIRGGENIYPVEIESRLMEHPDIVEAAVVGVDHRTLGQEVKAYVVTRPDVELKVTDVQEWVAMSLAPFKVPAHVEFRADLPHNATGKVMKHALATGSSAGIIPEV